MANAVTPYLDRVFTAAAPDESRRIYDEWATTYDSDMLKHDFTGPQLVAEGVSRGLKLSHLHGDPAHVLAGLRIADAGCGTGTVGVSLHKLGAREIVGLDYSAGMLEVARAKGVYSALHVADLTQELGFADGAFDALTCCGTFTHGHLGPGPLGELLRVVKMGGVVVATVLESHWVEKGFAAEVDRLVGVGACEVVESAVHQYRKDAGGGRLLILRRV